MPPLTICTGLWVSSAYQGPSSPSDRPAARQSRLRGCQSYRINQRRIIRLGRSLYRSVGQRAPENVTDRKALAKAIAALGSGDVLVVTSWIGDTVYARFSKHAGCCAKAGAGFRSLADVCLGRYHDTPLAADAHGAERIGGIGEGIDPIADGVREAARARGVRFGRKLKLTLHQQQEAILDKQPAKAWQRLAEAIT